MIKQGPIIREQDAPDTYFSSYEGKYNIMDNMDANVSNFVKARDEIYNTEYVYVTVVLQGTLNITIGGTDLQVNANEYLVVMPCMSVTVHDSQCTFFALLTRAHIMANIYKRIGTMPLHHHHAFMFRHAHFNQEQTNMLLSCYKRIKKEHLLPDYPMKENVLRAYQAAYLDKLFSFYQPEHVFNYTKNTRQAMLFSDFIELLNAKHTEERSVHFYAQAMNITPKYLSTLVVAHTGMTASEAIDQYVIYAIKQALYTNEHNIKQTSEAFHFPSQSFFGRYFKRVTGMSPNAYIKSNNIKSINFAKK